MASPQLGHQDYIVAWVCALPIEVAAAQAMLDEVHPDPPRNDKDPNVYTLGRIGEHNVVIACLPVDQAAIQMKTAFPSIRFGVMVGIGGGVPSAEADICLGDLVSQPYKEYGKGLIPYGFGKDAASGLERTSSLDVPPTILVDAISKVKAKYVRGISMFSKYLSKLTDLPLFARGNAGPDILDRKS